MKIVIVEYNVQIKREGKWWNYAIWSGNLKKARAVMKKNREDGERGKLRIVRRTETIKERVIK